MSLQEYKLQEYKMHREEEKDAIAEAAFKGSSDGLNLDAGSPIGRLIVRVRRRATVITNSLNSILTLADAPGVSVVVLARELRALNQATPESTAMANLRVLRADRAVLGGTTTHPDCRLAAPAVAHALLGDRSKLARARALYWTALDCPWALVTDPAVRQRFADLTASMVVAAPRAALAGRA